MFWLFLQHPQDIFAMKCQHAHSCCRANGGAMRPAVKQLHFPGHIPGSQRGQQQFDALSILPGHRGLSRHHKEKVAAIGLILTDQHIALVETAFTAHGGQFQHIGIGPLRKQIHTAQ